VLFVYVHLTTTFLFIMSSFDNELRVITWNVTGLMSSASYLSDILTEGDIDVCGLSEHWLTPNNLFFMDSISSDFDYFGKCDNSNRSKGGVAIMWNKRLSHRVVPIDVDDDRIVGIQMQISSTEHMFIFQVYLPCVNHS